MFDSLYAGAYTVASSVISVASHLCQFFILVSLTITFLSAATERLLRHQQSPRGNAPGQEVLRPWVQSVLHFLQLCDNVDEDQGVYTCCIAPKLKKSRGMGFLVKPLGSQAGYIHVTCKARQYALSCQKAALLFAGLPRYSSLPFELDEDHELDERRSSSQSTTRAVTTQYRRSQQARPQPRTQQPVQEQAQEEQPQPHQPMETQATNEMTRQTEEIVQVPSQSSHSQENIRQQEETTSTTTLLSQEILAYPILDEEEIQQDPGLHDATYTASSIDNASSTEHVQGNRMQATVVDEEEEEVEEEDLYSSD